MTKIYEALENAGRGKAVSGRPGMPARASVSKAMESILLSLYQRIDSSVPVDGAKIVGLANAQPGNDSATLLCEFAKLAALRMNKRVLVVATGPASQVSRIFASSGPHGWEAVVTGETSASQVIHSVGARLVIDNAFATPSLQRAISLGADVVVYSATKHIDGQGRCLGGAVLGSKDFIENTLKPFIRNTGPSISPFNAWVMLKGLETLDLRIERHCRSAQTVAEFLATHKKVTRTLYPGLPSHPGHAIAMGQMEAGGGMITFDVKGAKAETFAFLRALKLVDISNNLGDSKSLITHPATTTHQRLPEAERNYLGIFPGTVRISVGLEDVDDILQDLDQALAKA